MNVRICRSYSSRLMPRWAATVSRLAFCSFPFPTWRARVSRHVLISSPRPEGGMVTKVLAARFYRAGDPLTVEEMPTPPVGDGDVLVQVKATGICHSDLHTINGLAQIGVPPPLTLGHEASGEVVEK